MHKYIISKDLSALQDNPQAIIDAISEYASKKTHEMMIFQQHTLDVSRQILEAMDPIPKLIVELGTYVGNSAVAWGAMLKT